MSENLNQSTPQSTVESAWTEGGQSTVHPPYRGGRGRIVRPEDTSKQATGYVLTLEPKPGNWQRPPEQRLRALLKAALRAFGFKAVAVKVTTPTKEDRV